MEQRRLAAARLLRAGRRSQAEIAREVGVSPAAVSQWARRLREAPGTAGLRRRPRTGRPPQLTPADWEAVRAVLQRGARASGFDTER